MQFLRQSTASQEISLGYFLDSTDGDTEETGLTIASTDIKIRKGGGTTLISKNSGGGTHISNGVYHATLDATDTNTLGMLEVYVHVSGALATKSTYSVLPATAYDALITDGLFNFDPATDTVATVTTLTGHTAQTGDNYARLGAPAGASVSADIADVPTVSEFNARTISATAAGNLEDTYDGTGYTDDDAPAKQSQLSTLANVGSAVHKPSSSYTLTTGTQSANLYTDTEALDGVRHTHTDSAGALNLEYHFLIGGGTPSSVQFTGYVTGNNDDVDVMGYDWVTASYKQIGNISGTASATNSVYSFDLFVDMVGSSADEGKVDVQLIKSSGLTSATLAVDQIFVAFSQGAEGYDGGAVWFNSNASNTGTEVNIDGTARNPVSTHAALMTLLGSTGLHKVQITPGSTMTLGAAMEGYEILGNGSVLALGTQNIGGSVFRDFGSITGVGTTTGSEAFFESCLFGAATVPPSTQHLCGYGVGSTTLSLGGAGDYTIKSGYSKVAGSGSPVFSRTGAGVVTAEFRTFSGGVTMSGIQGSDTYTIGGELGTVTLNGASATAEIRGIYKSVVDNRTGSPTLNTDGAIKGDIDDNVDAVLVDTSTTIPAQITTAQNDLDIITDTDGVVLGAAGVDKIMDEPLTGATHNVATSLGKRIRQLSSDITRNELAQGSGTGSNQIQLDTGASATDGEYDPSVVAIVDGTGAGQSRMITEYNGTTKTCTVHKDWKVNPDATSEFIIVADAGYLAVNEGLAQAGASTTITLNALASSVDDSYNGQTIFLTSGTGTDQARVVTDYNGTTKVATVSSAWSVTPNSTSNYFMLPYTLLDTDSIASAVLTAQMTESYAADGVAPTIAQALLLIQQTIGDFSIAGTTITTKKLDGSTTAATHTLDDGTNPTSRTRTT